MIKTIIRNKMVLYFGHQTIKNSIYPYLALFSLFLKSKYRALLKRIITLVIKSCISIQVVTSILNFFKTRLAPLISYLNLMLIALARFLMMKEIRSLYVMMWKGEILMNGNTYNTKINIGYHRTQPSASHMASTLVLTWQLIYDVVSHVSLPLTCCLLWFEVRLCSSIWGRIEIMLEVRLGSRIWGI